ASFILEEGLPLTALVRIARSMADAACEAGVAIVTGDTKVVERGKGDGAYLSTTGLGWIAPGVRLSGASAHVGDAIVLSGSIGEHGLAVLSQREGLQFDSPIVSDTAPLNSLVHAMLGCGARLRVLRDPTRGGVATTLNEIAAASGVGMMLDEAAIPLQPAVQGACELMGLDPLYLANEGKLLALCHPDDVDTLLATLHTHPLGTQARCIGTVTEDPHHFVQMRTAFGGCRMLDWLMGDPLPRIC
ncbi:MAG: hydrogenase expression/formation protein HypE, partial [Aquabacterium sp.]|uniref:hydrogenase expression/formation protein HypE n=1 Tax=Aquabacterium sp. TaxID=1872578 RepID=UPI002A364DEF